MALGNICRGMAFFSWFLPSFTNLGYVARRGRWGEQRYNFDGQNWVVTGASEGIGRQIALQAAEAGATVYAIARSAERLDALVSETASMPGVVISVPADLSVMTNVDDVVSQLQTHLSSAHVLVNNVGIMADAHELTSEGHEKTFATNLLGPFRLVEQMLERSLFQRDAAVINVSSGGMYNVPLTLGRLQGGKHFDGMLTYAYHKRAAVTLNSWWRTHGLNSYVMHPGWVATPGVETSMPRFHQMLKPVLRDVAGGADTILWLAAERPEQATNAGIWFDRKLRPEHLLGGTTGGASAQELVDCMEQCLTSADQTTVSDAAQLTDQPADQQEPQPRRMSA